MIHHTVISSALISFRRIGKWLYELEFGTFEWLGWRNDASMFWQWVGKHCGKGQGVKK